MSYPILERKLTKEKLSLLKQTCPEVLSDLEKIMEIDINRLRENISYNEFKTVYNDLIFAINSDMTTFKKWINLYINNIGTERVESFQI